MTQEHIIHALIQNTKEVLPELVNEALEGKHSLRDLGANSLDRADIIIMTLETLNVEIPLVKLGSAKNIEDLARIIYESASS